MPRLALLPLLVLLAPACQRATAAAPPTFHRFTAVADGIYIASATGGMNVGSNSAVIVNDRDVVVVDSHITPAPPGPCWPTCARSPTSRSASSSTRTSTSTTPTATRSSP